MRVCLELTSARSRDGALEGAVEVRDRAELYRDPDSDDEVVLEVDGERIPLGVEDVTVSQCRGDDPAMAVEVAANHVRVRNCRHARGAVVERATGEREGLEAGESTVLVTDATLDVGFATRFELSVRAE